jgi:hypothetical protein
MQQLLPIAPYIPGLISDRSVRDLKTRRKLAKIVLALVGVDLLAQNEVAQVQQRQAERGNKHQKNPV